MENNKIDLSENTIDERNLKKIGWIYFAVLLSLTVFRIFVYTFLSETSDNVLDMVFTSVTQILLMGILPFFAYTAFVSKGNAAQRLQTTANDFGYKTKLSPIVYISAIIIGLLLFFANYGAAYVSTIFLKIFGYNFSAVTPTMIPNVGYLFMWIFFTAVLPACFEEMSHRGLLLGTMRHVNEKQAIIISALMFALMHQNIVQTFYAFIAGIILGKIACYTKSIFPAMIIHFLNNALGVVLDYSEQHGGKIYEVFTSVFSDLSLSKLAILVFAWTIAYYAIFRLLDKVKLFCAEGSEQPKMPVASLKIKYNNGLIFAIVLGIITTIITFVWGLLR